MSPQEKHPLVSVCIQTYNHEKYIRQSIESVLAQKTDFDFEIIIGEDQSSDNTLSICEEYEAADNRIRLFRRKREDVIFINGRPTNRYNISQNILAASGKYISFLDGDDYLNDPNKLQRQANVLENEPAVTSCFHETYSLSNKGQKVMYHLEDEYFDLQDLLQKRAAIHISSLMIRRENLRLPEWFFQVPYADLSLLFLNIKEGRFKGIQAPMSVYRLHKGGYMNRISFEEIHLNRIKLYDVVKSEFQGEQRKLIQDEISRMESLISSPIKTKLRNLLLDVRRFLRNR